MVDFLKQFITVDGIATALVGIVIVGMIFKKAFDGYIEARAKMQSQKSSPILTMTAAVWDRDQQEKFLELMGRIALALETQALHQGALASRQAQEVHDMISDIADRVNALSVRRPVSRRRRAQAKT